MEQVALDYRKQVDKLLYHEKDIEEFYKYLRLYNDQQLSVVDLLSKMRTIVKHPDQLPLFEESKCIIRQEDQHEYELKMPKLSDGRTKNILLSALSGERIGFSIRGGVEYHTGIIVGGVEAMSVASRCGIEVGDEIIRVNNYNLKFCTHREATSLIAKHKSMLALKIRRVGMIPIPVSSKSKECRWVFADVSKPNTEQENGVPEIKFDDPSSLYAKVQKYKDKTVVVNWENHEAIGFNIVDMKAGVFISNVKQGSPAEDAGIEQGDEILEVNGIKFNEAETTEIIQVLKSSKQLKITLRTTKNKRNRSSNNVNINFSEPEKEVDNYVEEKIEKTYEESRTKSAELMERYGRRMSDIFDFDETPPTPVSPRPVLISPPPRGPTFLEELKRKTSLFNKDLNENPYETIPSIDSNAESSHRSLVTSTSNSQFSFSPNLDRIDPLRTESAGYSGVVNNSYVTEQQPLSPRYDDDVYSVVTSSSTSSKKTSTTSTSSTPMPSSALFQELNSDELNDDVLLNSKFNDKNPNKTNDDTPPCKSKDNYKTQGLHDKENRRQKLEMELRERLKVERQKRLVQEKALKIGRLRQELKETEREEARLQKLLTDSETSEDQLDDTVVSYMSEKSPKHNIGLPSKEFDLTTPSDMMLQKNSQPSSPTGKKLFQKNSQPSSPTGKKLLIERNRQTPSAPKSPASEIRLEKEIDGKKIVISEVTRSDQIPETNTSKATILQQVQSAKTNWAMKTQTSTISPPRINAANEITYF